MAGNPLLIPQDAIEPPLAQFLDAEHREAREAKARRLFNLICTYIHGFAACAPVIPASQS